MKFQVVHYKDEQECSCHAGVYKPLSCSTSLAVSVVCLCAQNERMRKSNLKSNSYRQPLYLISNCRCNFEPPGMGYQCILLRKSTKNRIQSVYSQLSNTLGARQSSRLIREEVAYGKIKKIESNGGLNDQFFINISLSATIRQILACVAGVSKNLREGN